MQSGSLSEIVLIIVRSIFGDGRHFDRSRHSQQTTVQRSTQDIQDRASCKKSLIDVLFIRGQIIQAK